MRCKLRSDDTSAVITVEDTGPGVPADLREIIFEPYRQERISETFGGTGLGLTIAREFVKLHDGDISVAGAPDGGALFQIILPLFGRPEIDATRTTTVSHEGSEVARQGKKSMTSG